MKKNKKQEQSTALRDRALALLRSGKHEAALESLAMLEELEPEQPDWPRRAAESHRALGNRRGQIEALDRAAERYVSQGATAKAIAMFRMILNLDPRHARTQSRLLELQGTPAVVEAPPPPAQTMPEPPRRRLVAPPPPENPEPSPAAKADAPARPSLEQVLRQRRAASPRRPPAEAPKESPIAIPIPEPIPEDDLEIELIAAPVSEPIALVEPEAVAEPPPDHHAEPEILPDELEISSMPAPRPSVPAALGQVTAPPTPVPPSDEAVTLRPPRFASSR